MTYNPSIRIFVNKIVNRITFTIRTGYYLQLLKPEMVILLGSTESKIRKDEMVKVYKTGLETTDYNDSDELFFAE